MRKFDWSSQNSATHNPRSDKCRNFWLSVARRWTSGGIQIQETSTIDRKSRSDRNSRYVPSVCSERNVCPEFRFVLRNLLSRKELASGDGDINTKTDEQTCSMDDGLQRTPADRWRCRRCVVVCWKMAEAEKSNDKRTTMGRKESDFMQKEEDDDGCTGERTVAWLSDGHKMAAVAQRTAAWWNDTRLPEGTGAGQNRRSNSNRKLVRS